MSGWRIVPERSLWVQCAALLLGFVVGPLAALRVAIILTPGADFVQSVSVVAFAAVFVGGMLIWLGLGIAVVVLAVLWAVIRGRRRIGPERPDEGTLLIPPGYQAFVVLGLLAGMGVGVLAGLVTDLSLPAAAAVWTLLGLGYGGLLWAAAHHGYLPFDPD